MKTRTERTLAPASAVMLVTVVMWMLGVTASSARPISHGFAATQAASHFRSHRATTRSPGHAYRDGGRGTWKGTPGYGSALGPGGSTWRSWIEMEHYLDPCHCPGSGV
jgi:hypothetical protein